MGNGKCASVLQQVHSWIVGNTETIHKRASGRTRPGTAHLNSHLPELDFCPLSGTRMISGNPDFLKYAKN